jgi:uncharacterized protein YdaT
MPWTGPEFKKRHAKKLSGKQAGKAARIANAILRREGEGKVGMAIATGIDRAKGMPVRPRAR